jgi:hypothetical protein
MFLVQDFIDDPHLAHKQPSLDQQKIMAKSFDLLVPLDSSITGLISVAYQPTHLVGVLSAEAEGNLILGRVSHLDAFSAYPIRTWLPSNATGVTTRTPSVRSLWSSRTRSDTPQVSYARTG